MRGALRYMAALLAVLALLGAAALALAGCVTTGAFLREVCGTQALRAQQQERINSTAGALAEAWQLSMATLAPYVDGAVEKQSEAMAAWWDSLWNDPGAEPYLPAFLDAAAERELVNAIMQDEGFRAATSESQRRAIARDEVAYALDEAVCETVTPLRRSIVELGASLLMARVDLPQLRQWMLIGAAVLAAVGLLLMLSAWKMAGSILTASGGVMALCAALAAALDVPGMLRQLNPIAAAQGCNALACMAMLWLGAAAALAVMGVIIICIKRAKGGRA